MKGWRTEKLTNLVSSITTGKLDANAMVSNGRYRFYTCAKEFYRIDKYAFDDEALLISGNGEYVGYIHYYKGKFNAYQRVYVLTGFGIDVLYLKNYLDRYLPLRINKEVSQNNIPYIRLSTLSKMNIYYPESKSEQTAIANILSKVDETIAAVQNSIDSAERLKKGLMQNLLTGKMKPDGTFRTPEEFYIDEKFGKVPVGWDVKRIDEVFDFYPTASYSRSMLSDEGVCKYIHYGDIHTKFNIFLNMSEESLQYISKEMIKKFVLLKDGDIIISDTSEDYEGVGKLVELVNVGETKVIAGLHTLMLRAKTNYFVDGFKGYLFNEERVRLGFLKYVTGIKVYSISKNSLSKILIPIPPVEEQEQIKKKLDAITNDILASKSRIEKLERLKKSLMQNLLTGKVKIS